MRRVAIAVILGVALVGFVLTVANPSGDDNAPDSVRSSGGNRGEPDPSSVPTAGLAPGFSYTDCSKIKAGDKIVINEPFSAGCDPANEAMTYTVDCISGIYVLLVRPGGDLEGIQGRTDWLTASPAKPETGRTEFAFNECLEGDY